MRGQAEAQTVSEQADQIGIASCAGGECRCGQVYLELYRDGKVFGVGNLDPSDALKVANKLRDASLDLMARVEGGGRA